MSNVLESPTLSTVLVDEIQSLEPTTSEPLAWQPPYEVVRTARGVTVSIDLPGVQEANLHLVCEADRLRVWGHRAATSNAGSLEKTTRRSTGVFALDTALPENVEPLRIFRSLENGVLTVFLPFRRASVKRAPAA